jgi:hypothetical protein
MAKATRRARGGRSATATLRRALRSSTAPPALGNALAVTSRRKHATAYQNVCHALIRGGDIPERLTAHVRELPKQGRLIPS